MLSSMQMRSCTKWLICSDIITIDLLKKIIGKIGVILTMNKHVRQPKIPVLILRKLLMKLRKSQQILLIKCPRKPPNLLTAQIRTLTGLKSCRNALEKLKIRVYVDPVGPSRHLDCQRIVSAFTQKVQLKHDFLHRKWSTVTMKTLAAKAAILLTPLITCKQKVLYLKLVFPMLVLAKGAHTDARTLKWS